jgi:protein-L-isoaspartate(D-aspartate) O-methyltransferase
MTNAAGAHLRTAMIDQIRRLAAGIPALSPLDEGVLDAMSNLPRHQFVTDTTLAEAYADRPLAIGQDQTISQPFIVALMSSLAALEPGDRVLEVGTGSGYQTAILAALTEQVFSIETVPELAQRAGANLQAQGVTNVMIRTGDGHAGWPDEAPFDAIVVTAAPRDLPSALTDQLAPGGRLVIPLGRRHQVLTLIRKGRDGSLTRTSVVDVRFVPLVPQ